MGVVYRARQLGLNRTVALKMVLGADPNQAVRFLAEAEAVAAVRHSNVVPVYEFGEADGRPYLALEFCPGGTLRGDRRPPKAAAELMRKVAAGVAAAHALGIVHRDLKPANVLLDAAGEPKVTDFGLAKRVGGVNLTRSGAVMGTPAYMSPEQAGAGTKVVGPTADVWSLGVILYEVLAGERPFAGADTWEILGQVMKGEYQPLGKRSLGLPHDLVLICDKCLRPDARDRYPTAAELSADLVRFLAGEPVSIRPPGSLEKVAKWARRKPTQAAAYGLTLLTVVLAGLGSGAVWLWREAEAGRRQAVAAQANEETQRVAAEVARGEAERARDALAKAQDTLARGEYARTLRLAHQAWRDNDVIGARRLLDSTRPDLRGWEWRYVHRLSHADLLTLRGHADQVNSAAFSPDGSQVVTAGEDWTARVWDARTGAEVAILKGHADQVNSAAFSPDGSRVVTAGWDRTARVWDARTGAELLTLRGHAGAVREAGFGPDGSRVVAAGSDGTARVWDTRTGAELLALRGHEGGVLSAGFSPDGSRVVTAGDDRTARVWDARTGSALALLKGHAGGVLSVGFSPDGSRVVTAGSDRTARVWDARTGAELLALRGHAGWILSAAFSPDGSRVVTAGWDRTARVWDARTGAAVLTIKGHADAVLSVSFSSDGTRVVTAGRDGTARVWDALAGAEGPALGAGPVPVLAAGLSPEGGRVVTAGNDGTARVADVKTGDEVLALRGPPGGSTVGFSQDGTRIITASSNGIARYWDATPLNRDFLPPPSPAAAPRPGP